MPNKKQTLANEAGSDDQSSMKLKKRWFAGSVLGLWLAVGTWNVVKPMPAGTDMNTPSLAVAASEVRFLKDLTYADPQGKVIHEQQIFDEVFSIIEGAETFIVADFFLFNDLMGAENAVYRPLSRQLADRLLAKKRAQAQLKVLLITDPINEVYGGIKSSLLDELRAAGVDVVVTNLVRLRDSNPLYSPWWRMLVQWWGNEPDEGAMPNPFDTGPSKITLRSWLALANFKANHRKLIVADRADGTLNALVTSANPHDGSSAHSNVAVRFTGDLAKHLVDSELAIARFSGWNGHVYASAKESPAIADRTQLINASYITEQGVREHLLGAIAATRNGDTVRIATFYISDRKVIDALLSASARGVGVQMILDANRDAFGRTKDGVPNRPVANELVTKSGGKIQVRWYRTHGEQFHTKLALITRSDRLIASIGSANLTRRNIGNYNLEANVGLEMSTALPLATEMLGYFNRLWNNEGPSGTEYTAPFGAYQDTSAGKYWRYRIMEATGLSTF
jgi:phosphatidylserine/phosphatidylglycerophosphate/cardiolipin synthase-like enzyme